MYSSLLITCIFIYVSRHFLLIELYKLFLKRNVAEVGYSYTSILKPEMCLDHVQLY